LNAATASFRDILKENTAAIDTTLQSTAKLSKNLAQATSGMEAEALSTSIARLNASLSALESFLDGLNSGEGTLGQLTTDQDLYLSLVSNLEQLDLLLQDMRLNPKRYLSVSVFGKKQKEYTLPTEDPADAKNQ